MRFTHAIWDFDGTLFDSYPVMAAAFHNALMEWGIDEPIDAIHAYMKISMGDALRHYQEQYRLSEDFSARYKSLGKSAERGNIIPFAGVAELCKAIRQSGGSNYLLTHRGESAVFFMEKYGLLANFTELVTSK